MKRVLFVDDERQVLDGLRASLRIQRNEWDMMFVGGGEEALAVLERSPCDVIVSDMRMPGMDGATLLRRVQASYPTVVRIVLSGFVEFETALRTVPVAHQFLVKPCDPDVLVNVVERACAVQELVRSDRVRELVGRLDRLPALPAMYLELTQVLAHEEAGLKEAARVVERDPATVARVLQLANSALLGLGREVAGVEQAVLYLGTNMLKNMVLATQVFADQSERADRLGAYRSQRHSLLVGTIARQVAAADRRTAEDAFMAGILHDLGKHLLPTLWPDEAAAIELAARTEGRPVHAIESERLGTTHAELGAHLLAAWGLPYPVIEAVANHHQPRRVRQPQGMNVLAAVHVANALANELTRAAGDGDLPFTPIDDHYLRELGLHDQLPEWRGLATACLGATRSAQWIDRPGAQAA